MSFLVDIKNISWSTPDGTPVLAGLTLTFGHERTGLVGRNGSGKSTLLGLISGDLTPLAGAAHRTGTMGVLRQRLGLPSQGSVADALGAADGLAVLARIEQGAGNEDDFNRADWTLPERAASALAAMGLQGLDPARPLSTLSGGQATRAALAALVLNAPDLILLDEPTNNLDAGGRAAVADLLDGWKSGAIVASHDRALLERVDRIVELSGLGARVYGGGWSLYAERRREERDAAMSRLEIARREGRRVDEEAQEARERQARRDRNGRLKRARGDAPRILVDARKQRAEQSAGRGSNLAARKRGEAAAAMADAARKVELAEPLRIRMPEAAAPENRRVLAIEGVGWRAPGGAWILRGLSMNLSGTDRVAVMGANGTGKSTLLGLAAGTLAPSEGHVHRHGAVAMLDQQVALLRPDQSVLENCRRLNPALSDNEAHAVLARFLFRNDAALKPAGSLSGGERLRAGLACVLAGIAPALLILDEPTNHLDIESIEMVEAALADYGGALLLVSHDEAFLAAVGVDREIRL